MELTITKIGEDFVLILPEELLHRVRWKTGDKVFVSEEQDGLKIVPYDEDLVETLKNARFVMEDDRELLQKLAE